MKDTWDGAGGSVACEDRDSEEILETHDLCWS